MKIYQQHHLHIRQTVNMKNGFTMIELIFIIVILGILAAVAIPKLAAVKEEAKQAEQLDINKTTQSSPEDNSVSTSTNFPNTIYISPSK